MSIANIPRATGRGYLAFVKRLASNREKPNVGDHIAGAFVLFLLACILFGMTDAAWESYQFNHLSAAGHLAKAKEACGSSAPNCGDPQTAIKNLRAIPSTAAEFPEASHLLVQVNDQNDRAGRERMIKNFNGATSDPFKCGQSAKDNQDIVSFDGGQTWWKDDGRCAVKLQKKRDDDAQINSYWSTTIRVDTDMNSLWLADEERVCQTYPGSNGKVATVRCSATSEDATHNIPVDFWGGVNRNTVSDWKCRREKGLLDDRFVCRAID